MDAKQAREAHEKLWELYLDQEKLKGNIVVKPVERAEDREIKAV